MKSSDSWICSIPWLKLSLNGINCIYFTCRQLCWNLSFRNSYPDSLPNCSPLLWYLGLVVYFCFCVCINFKCTCIFSSSCKYIWFENRIEITNWIAQNKRTFKKRSEVNSNNMRSTYYTFWFSAYLEEKFFSPACLKNKDLVREVVQFNFLFGLTQLLIYSFFSVVSRVSFCLR